jgi:alkyl sulfatase BDS1-like metallo-beta-lactamase superfamily hydrolase
VKPVVGQENVKDILVSTRDATQYVYDQTIRGINNGYTADELSNMIKLPASLENHPWLTYQKGQISWNVKQIYYGTLGWFEGDPTFLQPISLDERSSKIIEGFGGPKNVLLDVRKAIDNGEYDWASELVTYVLHVEPNNTEAKLLKAHTLRVFGQKTMSFDARHLALTNALELEGKITIDSNAISKANSEQIAEIPIEKLLYVLPTKLKSDKADNIYAVMSIRYPDIDKTFVLHFRHNILAITESSDEIPKYRLILDTQTHKSIMSGDLKLIDAINSKQVEFQGDKDNLLYLMGLIQEDSDGIPPKFKT